MLKDSARPRPVLVSAFVAPLALVAFAGACGGGSAASGLAKPPEFAPKDQAKCGVTKSQAEPLIVEWPSASRAQLESKARKGGVVVHYVGCEMHVLPQCTAPGKYGYSPTTRKKDRIVMRDADELYANIPVGAAKLESTLEKSGQLSVDMVIVGRYEAERARLRKDELEGDCAEATHVVSALTVGAFAFASGADATVSAEGRVLGAGAGAKSASKREVLAEDGDPKGCDGATPSDKAPPSQCGALLRLEVTALGEARKLTASCPAGTEWDGTQCLGKKVVTKVDCPSGTTWDGSRCAGAASCAAGSHFEAGRGCVGDAVAAAVVVPSRPSPAPAGQEAAVGGMVNLPAGSFMMGSNVSGEKPARRVSVAGFAMDVTEVTAGAYTACVRAGRCSAAGTGRSCNYGKSDKDNHPINCVDWDQATAYCGSVGKRLPTEEEWEYAARGTDGRRYPWGDEEPGARACWNQRSAGSTCSVGSYASGVFGLKDMAGNVWEWTASGYSDYGNNRASEARVTRGGGWFNAVASSLRSSCRDGHAPSDRGDGLGFRCAR